MAIRSDITVDWTASPRIVTVASPSAEVTMQDLYDTLRSLESYQSSMDDDSIVDAGGLEELGGGVKVGLTITLKNALLAFEARPGPTFELCRIGGGNLVATDSVGAYYDSPVAVTAYVQVVLANSSSATLQDLEAMQAGSFQGEVAVDLTSSYSGTYYPVGTHEQPVNNWPDAVAIADSRGIEYFSIHGNAVLSSTASVPGYGIRSQNQLTTKVFVTASANVENCVFENVHIASSTLDGNCWVNGCTVGNMQYIQGQITNSMLYGEIDLGGTEHTYFVDCKSACVGLGTTDLPRIDMAGGGVPRNTAFRNWAGPIKIYNCDHADSTICMDIVSGATIIVASTCVAGTLFVRGIADITDNSGGAFSVIQTGQLDPTKVAEMWTIMGLDANDPLTDTLTRRFVQSSALVQVHTGDPETTITTTRQ